MSYQDGPPPGQPPYGGGGQPPQYGGPPGYGQGGPAPQSNSTMAVAGLVTGIIGLIPFCCLGTFVLSIAALVLGWLGKKEIADSHGAKKGGGMATAAIALGIAGIVIGALMWILLIAIGGFDYSYYSDFE